jgi:arylsulfatase A-like enzyme
VLLLLGAELTLLPRMPPWLGGARLNPEFALDAYAAVDPSFRVIRDAMRPRDSGDALEFYAFLRANSGVHDRHVEPASVDFVRDLQPAPGPRPHIFLFIVDSLRRDYLSTHNPSVTFTPAIGAFAADSFPFERAFTRYAGTGLAVPSIWAGGLVFHKEYVTPFAPMNALKKLLDVNGYRQFLASDHITEQLFVPAADTLHLMRTVPEMQHSFCATMDRMIPALAARPADGRPIFGHARTLDLHIGNIWSAKVPAGESYPGFFAPYASRVRAIDACFGRFIAFLKEQNLYEQSVIVLTSDHGDSLGEEGRWGHGFTTFPEVLSIPLVIHLPPALRSDVEADLTRVAFATDITPTLYALLGLQPEPLGTQFGMPLFVAPGTDVSARRQESFLIASSYGPTYGLIQDNGRSLYIADGTYGREFAFDLRAGPAGRRVEVTDADRRANRQRIRDEVAAIAARYHFRQ